MKAIVQDRYGSADVLRFEDVETPIAGRGEVLLRVGAASAFIGDWHIMTGTPYAIRLVSGLRAPKQRVRGQDVAGTVEALGDGVTEFRVGDEVFGVGEGAFAEFARVKELGASVVREPYRPGGDGDAPEMWLATFEDPDGNYFQLASPMPAP